MNIPKIKGIIDRRILINYQVDKESLDKFLPEPFTPKLVNGKGIAGICLIRLKEIRPSGFPSLVGISSENGAHRIAVEWLDRGKPREGVYIPRRDTSSIINAWAGGTIFPGIHHRAQFEVQEADGNYNVSFLSEDGTSLSIEAKETDEWNTESVFDDLSGVSNFFEKGAVGYCPNPRSNNFDGLKLKTYNWKVSLLDVKAVSSSFFEDELVFPTGSVKFDNALLMKDIDHEWISLDKIARM
ncbi:MAG: DUF2071 domain-containing protein [Flavobacteriales bacterium]|nr:DUF2071 domain-containing protein [Flavobacteriales bacterium]